MADDGNENRGAASVASAHVAAHTVMARTTISPYDLSPSDNPGCVVSQPDLRRSNYDEWAADMGLVLMARKKSGFVDGSILKPSENSNDMEDWRCNNALVVYWLRLTVEPQIHTSLRTFKIGKDLWDHIKKRFSIKNKAKIGKIKADLAMTRQNSRTIESYFRNMTQLWTTLDDYWTPKSCKCRLCTCDLSGEIAKEKYEDMVYDFFRGLDDSYSNIRSTLLSKVLFPRLDDVYHAMTQEEDSRMGVSSRENRANEVSFAVQSSLRSGNRNEIVRLVYKSCGIIGHSIDQCFQTIGYLEWWGDKP